MSSGHEIQSQNWRASAALTMAALGVVFGDIGTSPLYALRECFSEHHGLALNEANILGVLSLIAWSLILIVTCKYLLFVLRADNKGEGGILALMALVQRPLRRNRRASDFVMVLGVLGASLLYGDGMITPAISVLSAMEGLSLAAPELGHYTVPLTIVILWALFWAQKKGTGGIGKVFGPVILVWFATLAIVGLVSIFSVPEVLRGLNPIYGIKFLYHHGELGLLTLGPVFLVVTGGEALYADMGHFGPVPIKRGWFYVAFPGLLLNYFGQGALLLRDPSAIENPFYRMAPSWFLWPLLAIATCAAVIASQALISGAFSLTRQAIQLGFLPRTNVRHTSPTQIGQIYSPFVNWLLFACTVFLVVNFRTSSNLASAYGIAVSLTMILTTVLMFYVSNYVWRWPRIATYSICGILLPLELAFFTANAFKIVDGGWFALIIGLSVLTLMTTWRNGRRILADRLRAKLVPIGRYLEIVKKGQLIRVPGTAIYMTGNQDLTPPALIHNAEHNKIIHENVILLTINTNDVPVIEPEQRYLRRTLLEGFSQIVINCGFMETPDIQSIVKNTIVPDLNLNVNDITYFMGRETVIPTDRPGMAQWREHFFALMSRNAQRATAYYNIPSDEVVEIGIQVEL